MDTIIEFNDAKYLVRYSVNHITEQDILRYKGLSELNEILQRDGKVFYCERIVDAVFEDIIETPLLEETITEETKEEETKNEEVLQQTDTGQDTTDNQG